MEQPAGLLRKMRQVGNVYRAFREYERKGKVPGESAKWKNEHTDIWNIVSEVNRLREKYA